MKKLLVLLVCVVTLSFFMTGCLGGGESADGREPANPTPADNPIVTESELAVYWDNASLALFDWDNELDLPDILGMPAAESTRELGNDADTFAGSFIRELDYEGIHLTLFSPRDNGETFYILEMNVTGPEFHTTRGSKVGDSLAQVLELYPELEKVPDGVPKGDDGIYRFLAPDQPYSYVIFHIENGQVVAIRVYHEFA